MALPYTTYVTANGIYPIPGKPSGRRSFPATFAAFGTFGGGTILLQAGFVDANGVTQWMNIAGSGLTAVGAVNIAMNANYFRASLTGATGANIGFWFG